MALSSRIELLLPDLLARFRDATAWSEELSPDERRALGPIRERLAWFVQQFLRPEEEQMRDLSSRELKRLDKLVSECLEPQAAREELQRAAMEIGALVPLHHPRSVEALESLLERQDLRVRVNACQSLGRIGGEEARKALVRARKDNDPRVRTAAANGLVIAALGSVARELRAGAVLAVAGRGAAAPALAREAGRPPAQSAADSEGPDEERNIGAFQAMADELLREHPNEYLAFCDGQYFGHSADLGELKVRVAHAMPSKPVLIVEPEGNNGDAEDAD